MVDVWLPYDGTEVCVRVPTENLQDILGASERTGVKNFEDEARVSLENPISSRRLSEIVRSGDRVVLTLSASDAPVVKFIIPLVLEEIYKAGLKSSDLTVLIAQDIFRCKMEPPISQIKNEISALGANVIAHSFSSETTYIGGAGGIKIRINNVLAESRVRISVSLIEPDPYILYRWGGSSILLGLSDTETVRQIFSPALNLEAPSDLIFKNIVEISPALGINFAINVVRNIKGEIVRFIAGDLERCLHESIRVADEIYRVSVEKRADIVFISPGGSPLDANVFEACRCIENALKIVRRNGAIILVAECLDGYGNIDFYEALSRFRGDLNSLDKSLQKRFTIGGFVAYRFLRALKRAYVGMVSALPDLYISEMGDLRAFRTANEALAYALGNIGKKSRVSLIPHGNLIIPIVEEKKYEAANAGEKIIF